MIHRNCLSYLVEWKNRSTRKPLILRGARQVGKSFLVRELFAKNHFHNYVELNFEQHPEFAELFSSREPDTIIRSLESVTGIRIEDGRTLLFLDEIQASPSILATLRYFYEKRRELHVIAAGSLLEFALSEFEYSIPVGRVEYLFMEPLSFEEFLTALGDTHLVEWLSSFHVGAETPDVLHRLLMEKIQLFWLIGGLPEAVQVYASTKSLLEVERIQETLVTTYMEDFAKYRRRVPLELLRSVFSSVPQQLGGKFTFVNVDRNLRSRELSLAVDLLSQARVMDCVCRTSGNGLPLGVDANTRNFKAYGLDIGLCARQLGFSIASLRLPFDESFLAERGGFCEQFVAEMLKCAEPYHVAHRLYQWAREIPSSCAEVDFLVQLGEQIIPIEVKAGTTGRMKSLHRFLIEKHRQFALRFNGDKASYLETSYTDEKGESHPFHLLSLPFYLIGQYKRLCQEDTIHF